MRAWSLSQVESICVQVLAQECRLQERSSERERAERVVRASAGEERGRVIDERLCEVEIQDSEGHFDGQVGADGVFEDEAEVGRALDYAKILRVVSVPEVELLVVTPSYRELLCRCLAFSDG